MNKSIVALTGANGRLGRHLVSALADIGISAVSVPRDVLETSSGISKYLECTRPLAVINSAAISQGSSSAMKKVNVDGATNLGKATHQIGIPFFQMSTTATGISGISEEQTPYAWSKSLAKKELSLLNNTTIIELDALIGTSQTDQIDISSLAAGGLPLTVKMLGNRHIIQPTSYQAASKAIANLVSDSINGEPIPLFLSAVGDPIALGDFIDLTRSSNSLFDEFELQVNPEDLHALANAVQNGALSREFLHLGRMAGSLPKVHDNENFEYYHDAPLPTHKELAVQMKQTTTFNILRTGLNIFKSNPQKMELIKEAFQVWGKCNVRKYSTVA